MVLRRLWLALALACSTLALPACAASTTVEHVWRSPAWDGSFEHVLILGMSKREGVRRNFEEGVAETLRAAGVQATASFKLFPRGGELSEAEINAILAEHDIDGALVARLVAIDNYQRYVDGVPYVVAGGGSPMGFYGYYHTTYGLVYSPVYSIAEQIVTVESNLYEVASGELVWSGLSETIDPKDVDDGVASYAKAMTKTLVRAGLVRAEASR